MNSSVTITARLMQTTQLALFGIAPRRKTAWSKIVTYDCTLVRIPCGVDDYEWRCSRQKQLIYLQQQTVPKSQWLNPTKVLCLCQMSRMGQQWDLGWATPTQHVLLQCPQQEEETNESCNWPLKLLSESDTCHLCFYFIGQSKSCVHI